MDLTPMMKTRIIEFGLLEMLLKLWKLSKNMRKRVKWVFEGKIVVASKYSPTLLKLTDMVKIGRKQVQLDNLKEICEGVVNYEVQWQVQLEELKRTTNQLKCYLKLKEHVPPVVFDRVFYVSVTDTNFAFYSDVSFNRIDFLFLIDVSQDFITKFLKKVNFIDKLVIWGSVLGKLALSSFQIKTLEFTKVEFNGRVKVSDRLDCLQIFDCENFDLLLCNTVESLEIEQNDCMDQIHLEWLAKIKGLVKINLLKCLTSYLEYLPSSVRKVVDIAFRSNVNVDALKIKEKLPFLIEVKPGVPFSLVKHCKLRTVVKLTGDCEGICASRPRMIKVDQFHKFKHHTELFEKVEYFQIMDKSFDFTWIPKGIKKIYIQKFRINSRFLSRFRLKFEQNEESRASFRENDC